jgi:hypothetical protein
MPLGIEAAINEDLFDLDELSEDEQEEVVVDATAASASEVFTSFSTLREVSTLRCTYLM